MTTEQGSTYEDTATSARRVGNLERAGEYYTRATFEYLGANGLKPKSYASKGLMYLLLGAICYRVDGQDSRATYRCRQGIALATDLSDQARVSPRPSHDYDAAERGIWDEFAGDFRVVGGIAPPEEAYEDARQIYRDAGDPRIGLAEQMRRCILSMHFAWIAGGSVVTSVGGWADSTGDNER